MRRNIASATTARKATISSTPVRLGFVPLNDCAPLVVAQEHGLFERFGVEVRLSRELGWATIRDKIVHGELDAAHAPCGLPLALELGLSCVPTRTVAGMVLNLNGNAITLSEELWSAGIRDALTLRAFLTGNRGRRTLTFGTVSPYSTHTLLLRRWLTQAGADFGRDVRFVVVPPQQMVVNLAAGHLDGFCAGEPWNSLAVAEGCGWIPATSSDLAPLHPEKVLLATADFAARRENEHVRIIAALLEACAFCDSPANQPALAKLLSDRRYLGQPAEVIARGFPGEFNYGHGLHSPLADFVVYHREAANVPTPEKAAWIARHLLDGAARDKFSAEQLAQIFRADLFAKAQELRLATIPHDPDSETRLLTA
ncbi:MAG TPA: CmpA/NrtA family ABC transporter substrate-binding protein [Candidatus Limnocylindria bacterium]|jgi:ABC-type nitrate/sulfonate/bicarbonate transport system substrate-binding protein|nr:CmpA/NrtA family ABC transporter substrate-binding protein [Candidatus Limnocylindria bacterium]